MPTYRIYYATGDYGKAWFDADNVEHAEYLISRIQDGKLCFDELPNIRTKSQGDELEMHSLKEMS